MSDTLFVFTVHDKETGDVLFTAEASNADRIMEEVGRAERYLKLRAEEEAGAIPDDEEPITEKEADRIETESHTHG